MNVGLARKNSTCSHKIKYRCVTSHCLGTSVTECWYGRTTHARTRLSSGAASYRVATSVIEREQRSTLPRNVQSLCVLLSAWDPWPQNTDFGLTLNLVRWSPLEILTPHSSPLNPTRTLPSILRPEAPLQCSNELPLSRYLSKSSSNAILLLLLFSSVAMEILSRSAVLLFLVTGTLIITQLL